MLFLPWDIVNIRKLKRNIVTSPSPICPCCMLNEKENSLSIIVIRTKRPRFIAFILTQWFSSLCRSRSFKVKCSQAAPPHPPMASSAQLCYLLIKHVDRRLTRIWIIKETFGSNFSPQFAHLFIYLFIWAIPGGVPISKWIFPHAPGSLCLAKLQNIPPLLSTRAGGEALTQGKWKIGAILSVWNQVALHNPQNPWFNSDWQITSWKTEKSRRKIGPLKLPSRLLQSVSNRMDSLTLTQDTALE